MKTISDFLEENYGTRISKETISNITEKVWPEIKSWRTRPLETVYPIVWMDNAVNNWLSILIIKMFIVTLYTNKNNVSV